MYLENERLAFLIKRDGLSNALIFAKRTVVMYRKAVLNPKHYASLPKYRSRFIQSYCAFKRFIRLSHINPYEGMSNCIGFYPSDEDSSKCDHLVGVNCRFFKQVCDKLPETEYAKKSI